MQTSQQITTINAAVLRRDNLLAAHPLANGESSGSTDNTIATSVDAASRPGSEATVSMESVLSTAPSVSKQAEIPTSQQIAQSLLSDQPRASASSLSDNISPFTKLKGFSLTPESSVGSPIQVFILESLFRFLSPHRVIFGLTPVTRKRSLDATSHSVYCFSYRWFLLWVVMILTYPMEEWPDWFVSFQSSLFFYLFFENTIFENTWKLVLVKMSLNLQKEKSLIQWCSWGGWGEGGMLYYS